MANGTEPGKNRLLREVEAKRERIEHARERKNAVWDSIAILGIGWSVVAPTLVGIAAGVWIDHRWPGRYSWTLILMVGGLIIGAINAWLRIREEEP